MTVLLAQEFGSNLGHVTRLSAVARALGADRYVFAVPHAEVAGATISRELGPGVEIVGGFRFSAPAAAVSVSTGDTTLADVFFNLGYGDVGALGAAARRWRSLLERVKPTLIISDFAPTLRLAVWNTVPHVVIGGAYETPPPDCPVPAVLPFGSMPSADSLRREEHLLHAINAVRASIGGPPVRFFSDLFQGDRVYPISPPGCDAYLAKRPTPSHLPITIPDIRSGPPAALRTGPDVFCFLWSDHNWLNTIVTALNGLRRRSQIHIRGIDPDALRPHCAPQIEIRTASADFATLLPQTKLFIHYGGAGAAYSALLAGTAQFILPVHLEQEMTARGMISNGVAVGVTLGDKATPERLRELISAALDDHAMHARAVSAARSARATRTRDVLPDIAAACRALLAN